MGSVFGGMMIGLAIILTFFISGSGLGASGALTSFAAWLQNLVVPSVTQNQVNIFLLISQTDLIP